jgi:hypothetical protein
MDYVLPLNQASRYNLFVNGVDNARHVVMESSAQLRALAIVQAGVICAHFGLR